jgi:uncharacterized protein (TIGR03435 family)
MNASRIFSIGLLIMLAMTNITFAQQATTVQATSKPDIPKDTIYMLTIRRNEDVPNTDEILDMSSRWSDRYLEQRFQNTIVVEVIRGFLNQPLVQTRAEGKMPEERLDVVLYASHPMSATTAKLRAVDTICDAFGLKYSRVNETHKGWKMTCPNTGRLRPTTQLAGKSAMAVNYDNGKTAYTGDGITLRTLATNLGIQLQQTIFDETNVSGRYDFTLPISDFATARKALETVYGIFLEEATREMEVLVIAPAPAK